MSHHVWAATARKRAQLYIEDAHIDLGMEPCPSAQQNDHSLGITRSPFNWVDLQLQLATRNEFVSLEILRYLYMNPGEPVLLLILLKKFKRQRICSNRATVWSRCLKLESLGLVRILHGNPISLWPADEVNPEKVKLLITRCYKSLLGDLDGC